MGIERLNKAVVAAGYAMAPEDDAAVDAKTQALVGEDAGRAIVPAGKALQLSGATSWASLQSAMGWMRSVVPSFGGRAPA